MKRFLFYFLFYTIQLFPQQRDTSIIFSEVMFYNSTSIQNGEFIELFNTSNSDTIDISGWKIKYYTSPADPIIDAGAGTKILPRQFAVIFEGDYSGGYSIPSNALILKISDNAFGSSGMANTVSRDIHLINSLNDTIWSYTYSADNSSGYSDEKIILIGDNSSSNWSNSIVLNGTPGNYNSISPKEFDLGIFKIISFPMFPVLNDTVEIGVWVKNFGFRDASNFWITFKYDLGNDGNFDLIVNSNTVNYLKSGDSVFVRSDSLIRGLRSEIKILSELNFTFDENKSNDTLSILIKPGVPSGVVLINEVMFDPRTGEPEWIELYNKSNSRINLKGWKVSDVLATPTFVTISNGDFYFEPQTFIVLASNLSIRNFYDSIPSPILIVQIPTLNNDKDGVVIYDDRGLVIDSLFYFSYWSISKRSIERINYNLPTYERNNWTASISDSGGTPGLPNSVVNIQKAIPMSVVINEIMYEPLSDNSEYIEIFNPSNDTINLAGWKIIEGGGKSFTLSSRTFYLKPNEYFIIASDSTIFSLFLYLNEPQFSRFVKIFNLPDLSLSNSGDIVILQDIFGNIIDSVAYKPDWHNPEIDDLKGRSLERINPLLTSNDNRNWTTSVNQTGGTPLFQNSVFTKKIPSSSRIEISPNPFSPDNDGFEDFTIISYQLPQETSQIRIRIFDSVGRLVKTLVDNEPSASSGSIVFNGLDNNKQPLRMGIYVILIEAINQSQGVIEQIKKPVVVAKKLR